VLGGVEGQLAQEFAGGGVDDDADVEVLDEDGDAGSGVGSADADGVEPAAVAQGDLAGFVDPVVANPIVGVAVALAWAGLGAAGVDGGWGCPVRQGSVRSAVVVGVDEGALGCRAGCRRIAGW